MPVPIARRTLLQERLRFVIAVGGVALAIALILVLQGLYRGINRQITGYLDHQAADLVVAQKDLRDFLGVRSRLSEDAEDQVSEVRGVRRVTPVIAQYVVLELHGRKEFTLLVGYDADRGGGPWAVTEGTSRLRSGEAVLDQALAQLRGLEVGDRMDILGRSFRIAGLSKGTSTFMTGTVFVRYDDASELLRTKGAPSFLLVEDDGSVARGDLLDRIEDAAPAVTVSTRETMNRNDIDLFAAILKGPVGFMVAVSFLIGVALVGQTIYTATVERAKDYGALKAIGARNRRLYLIVLEQAFVSSAVGAVFGIGFAYAAARTIEWLNPRFLVAIEPDQVAVIVVVAVVMGLVAALLPVRAIARIDPAIAFRRGA